MERDKAEPEPDLLSLTMLLGNQDCPPHLVEPAHRF